MTPKKQRMYVIIISLVLVTAATALILFNFQDNIVFFRTPSEISANPPGDREMLRVGGLVKNGSIEDLGNGNHRFVITDMESDLIIDYKGILPNLFREGQGIVAYGRLEKNGQFRADQILAKHDENYMPPEVYEELEKRGYLEK